MDIHAEKLLILDFGGQYTQLIARRIRELGVYCEIHRPDLSAAEIKTFSPIGIILSGGPASVDEPGAPRCDPLVLELGVPVLGICYGLQLLVKMLGGRVDRSARREYGAAEVEVLRSRGVFASFQKGERVRVWMNHGDRVEELPEGFLAIGRSANSPFAAAAHESRPIYGLQFHPEVAHTPQGREMLKSFLFTDCKASGSWSMKNFIAGAEEAIRRQAPEGTVICALSGGVDSSVTALLIHRAIGERLQCVFVDNGLLRSGERHQVEAIFSDRFHVPVKTVDAQERFLGRLREVIDPEQKRKIIGREFIAVFDEAPLDIPDVRYLAQGTLYPDVIESVSAKGPSATIKSHHNVGGLPEVMKLKLIEPLRELFKDEVRVLGRELGLPEELVTRHPFPGPGLAVRMIGDARTYDFTAVLRAVTSLDGMTADWARLPHDVLERISTRITNEVRGINRVVLDISSKPPATIEWE